MFCEAYNQSLTDAAASGERLSPALQQHLASCDSCRAAFAEEQSLFAAIDSGLRAAANAGVPTTLIPRVHVTLNNEPAPHPRRFSISVWGFAGAAVTAVIVFGLLYLPSKHTSKPIQSAHTFPIAASANPPAPSAVNSSRPRGVSPLQPKRPTVQVAIVSSKPQSPEVLVPDEERAAFAQFIARASSSSADISTKATLVPRAPRESVEISPVEIASLEVKPLNPKEERPGQF